MRALLSLLLLACLSACQSETVRDSGETLTIHLYQPQWSRAELIYRQQADNAFAVSAMTAEGDGWWRVQLPAAPTEFAFSNGVVRLDLGRTRGCYPESHYRCDEPDTGSENFRSSSGSIWVKDGLLFSRKPGQSVANDASFTLLTLNLHAYQEFSTPGKADNELTETEAMARVAAHAPLFDRISHAIEQLQPDAICLQEVAEWGGAGAAPGFGQHPSNAVRQLLARLPDARYRVQMDWSHYAWDAWKEGTAVLSRYPLLDRESRYISRPGAGVEDWRSRKVSRVTIQPPGFDAVNIFSVHSGWWEDEQEPFAAQFRRLKQWADSVASTDMSTILCGDFNQVAGQQGYRLMTGDSGFSDQYLAANPAGMYDATIGGQIAGWEGSAGGKRVDYILLSNDSELVVEQSQRIFTEKVYGRVSDHTGLYAHFSRH